MAHALILNFKGPPWNPQAQPSDLSTGQPQVVREIVDRCEERPEGERAVTRLDLGREFPDLTQALVRATFSPHQKFPCRRISRKDPERTRKSRKPRSSAPRLRSSGSAREGAGRPQTTSFAMDV